jgi:hypothetical protein
MFLFISVLMLAFISTMMFDAIVQPISFNAMFAAFNLLFYTISSILVVRHRPITFMLDYFDVACVSVVTC